MQFATGSYTGDGNDDRWINAPAFQPDLVIVKADAATWAVFRTSTMAAGDSAYFTQWTENFVNSIQAFGANGFQVGTDSMVNTNGVVYYYAAFRDTGGNDFHVGTYTGDGNDDRSIAGVGFQPTVVWTKQDGNAPAVWRVNENSNNDCLHFLNDANDPDYIQAFEADGFQIGTVHRVNRLNRVYHYVAFADATSYIQTGLYSGDGNDNRDIVCGFDPDMVWVKGDTTELSVLRIDTMDAGDSVPHADIASAANQIQAFEATNFEVGTSARTNSNGVTYYWAAWATGTSGATTTSTSTTSSSTSTTTTSLSTSTTSTSLSTTSSSTSSTSSSTTSTSISTTSLSTSSSTSTSISTSTTSTSTTSTSLSTTSSSTSSTSLSTTSSSTSTTSTSTTSTSTTTTIRPQFWRTYKGILRRRLRTRA